MAATTEERGEQDPHSGKSGTFVIDHKKGVRVPLEEWEARQQPVHEIELTEVK